MHHPAVKAVIKTYLVIALIIGVLVSPPPQIALALILLATQLYAAYKPPRPLLNLALIFGAIIFTPLTLTALVGEFLSVLFIVPAILLVNHSLHEIAPAQIPLNPKPGRKATPTLKTLIGSLTIVFLAALILLNKTLLLTAATLLLFIAAVLAYTFRHIPKAPLKSTRALSRTLVGSTTSNSTDISNSSKLPLTITLTPLEPWAQIKPSNLKLTAETKESVNLSFTPPLAGPSKLQVQAYATDPWGLTQTSQTLEPVELHIIPRAKYAQWLAKKYLEQTASGTTSTAAAPRISRAAKSGVEYYGSRLYQPGDRLKDVDWKHTYTLGELVVKKFAGARDQPVIIVADLTAKDAQEADRLSYNIVMAALTSAMESLPSALALYNQKEVIAATTPTNPRETLKKTLRITEKITITERLQKTLQPTEILRIKRTIREVKALQERLAEVLGYEVEATLTTTRLHQATLALAKAVENVNGPAIATVASWPDSDSGALSLALARLKEKGFSIVLLVTKV